MDTNYLLCISLVLIHFYREGLFLGSVPPYGYLITKDKKLIIRSDESPLIVKEIFEMYL